MKDSSAFAFLTLCVCLVALLAACGQENNASLDELDVAPAPAMPSPQQPDFCSPEVSLDRIRLCSMAQREAWAEFDKKNGAEGLAMTQRRYDQLESFSTQLERSRIYLRKGFIQLRYGLADGHATNRDVALGWLEKGLNLARSLYPTAQCLVHSYYRFRADDLSRKDQLEAPDREIFDNAVSTASDCIPACDCFVSSQSALPRSLSLRAQYFRLIGDQYHQYQDLTRALEILEKYDPDLNGSEALRIRFSLAELYHDLGDVTEAEGAYMELRQLVEASALDLRLALLSALGSLYQDLASHGTLEDRLSLYEKAEQAFLELRNLTDSVTDPATFTMAQVGLASVELDRFELELPSHANHASHLALAESVLAKLEPPPSLLPRQRHYLEHERARLDFARARFQPGALRLQQILNDPRAEPERVWRAYALLAEYSDELSEPAHVLYWRSIFQIEGPRQKFARAVRDQSVWTLAYTSQRWEMYARWLEALVDVWQEHGASSSAGHAATWDANTVFSGTSISADDLLVAMEKLSTQSFTAALFRGRNGLEGLAETALQRDVFRLNAGGWLSGPELRQLVEPEVTVAYYHVLPKSSDVLLLVVNRSAVVVYRIDLPPDLLRALYQLPSIMNGRPEGVPPELERLGNELLLPLLPHLHGSDAPLALVLNGPLERIPFAALQVRGRYLIEQTLPYTIPNLTSVGSLNRFPRDAGPLPALGIGFGVDRASEELDLLRTPSFTPDRIEGAQATRERLREAVKAKRLVHLALHGSSPGAFGNATGQCGERSAGRRDPACLKLANGALTGQALRDLPLEANLLVLSACRTLVGAPEQPEPGVASLSREALIAGADAVIASAWEVGDDATYELMKRFYQYFPAYGRAMSLALAQRAMIQAGGSGRLLSRQLVLDPNGNPSLLQPLVNPLCRWPTPFPYLVTCPPPPEQRHFSDPWSWAGFSLVGGWN